MARERNAKGQFTSAGGGGGGGGGAAGGVFSSVILDVSQVGPALGQLNAATQASATALKQVETAAEAEARAVREAAEAARAATVAENAHVQSLGNTFIALEKVQVAGLKYQDTLEKSTNKAASFSRGMIDVSRGIEDFATGGFLGVLNNIPGIFQNMGAAIGISGTALAGWTAGVSLAATGLFILYKNWGMFATEAKSPFLQTATQEMEKLAAMTERTAEQQERLNKLKADARTTEGQRTRATPEEKAAMEATGTAINAAGFTGLENILTSQLRKRVQVELEKPDSPLFNAFMGPGAKGGPGANPFGGEANLFMKGDPAARATEEHNQRIALARERAQSMLREAETGTGPAGDKARRDLIGVIDKFPQLFDGFKGLRQSLQDALPEERKRQTEEVAGLEAEAKRNIPAYDAAEREKKAGVDAAAAIDAENLGHYTKWKAQIEADDKKWRAAEDEKFKDDASEYKKQAMNKIEDRVPLSKHEMEAIGEEGRRTLREKTDRDATTRATLDEKESDLLYERYQVMNPNRQGQTMGLDQYEASIKSQSGETLEAKRLHRLIEINEDILSVQEKKRGLTVRAG